MENKLMTNQESLDLITRMIKNSQEKFERGSGKPFLIWGYTTLVVSLAVWCALKATGDYHWNWLWFAIPVIGTIGMLMFTEKRPKSVTTFIDRAIAQTWMVLGICGMGVTCYAFFSWQHIPTLVIIAMLMFVGEAITGGIIRLNYIRIMGLIGIVLSFGLSFLNGFDQILGFGGLFLVAMIIPGHIMNRQAGQKAAKQSK